MNYEKTKEMAMRHCPRLFLTEEDFLSHVFFVNGNGMQWFNGELTYTKYDENGVISEVSEADLEKQNLLHKEEMRKNAIEQTKYWKVFWKDEKTTNRHSGIKEYKGYDADDQDDEIEYRQSRIHDLEADCWFLVPGESDPKKFGHKMYPICQYAKIMNIPEDIKPDWLQAAKKAIEWAESPYCRMTSNDKVFIERAKERICEFAT